jgi:hypothetical protein
VIPSRFIVRCPACGVGLEAALCSWRISLVETEDGQGIGLEMSAFIGHVCEEPA